VAEDAADVRETFPVRISRFRPPDGRLRAGGLEAEMGSGAEAEQTADEIDDVDAGEARIGPFAINTATAVLAAASAETVREIMQAFTSPQQELASPPKAFASVDGPNAAAGGSGANTCSSGVAPSRHETNNVPLDSGPGAGGAEQAVQEDMDVDDAEPLLSALARLNDLPQANRNSDLPGSPHKRQRTAE
jgi:hypothetical protein